MRKLSLLLSLLLFPCLVQAQGALRRSEARSVSGPAIPGAQIYVCTSTAPLTPAPCQSNGGTEASIYSDIGLSVPITQPVVADGYGNFQYYASAGSYVESITGPGVVSISYPVMLAGVGTGCAAAGTNGSLLYNNGGTCGASNLIYNGTSVLCKNFENIRCADQFSGASSQAQINSAVSDLSTTPGFVLVPGNMAANSGNWATPPNNVAIWDQRFINDQGLMEGGLPNQHSHWYLDLHAGANDSYESGTFSGPVGLSVNVFADAGGTSGVNSKAGLVGAFFGATRALASNRPMWALNAQANYQSAGSASIVTTNEVDINNSGSADDTNQYGVGLRIISGSGASGKKAGVGISITNSTGAGGVDSFERGIGVSNYVEDGLHFSSGSSRTADIYRVPPADDTALSDIWRNHADSATVASVNDSGVAEFTGVGINGGCLGFSNCALNAANPTISSGFNTGSITAQNGTTSFNVTVGTGSAASTGVLSLPTATHGWTCHLDDQSRADLILQSANTASSATFTNYGTTFTATNWTNGDVLVGICTEN